MDNKKLTSRKFIVWLTATIFVLMSFITYLIIKDNSIMEVTKTFSDGWIWVSGIYIGSNAIQKFANKQQNNEELEQ